MAETVEVTTRSRLSLVSEVSLREPMRRYDNPPRSMDSTQVEAEIREHLEAADAWRAAAQELERLRTLVPTGYMAWGSRFTVKNGCIVIEVDARLAGVDD